MRREWIPVSLGISRPIAGMVGVLVLVYLCLCSRPIWHTDVWGHLSYGRYIWRTQTLPATEPLLPLARGVPFIDGQWLSQLVGLGVMSQPRLQVAGLKGLYALLVTGCAALLCRSVYQQTRHGGFALLSLGLFLIIGWIPLSVLRPQLAGLFCFILVLTRLARNKMRKSDGIVIPLVFGLWANLHPSFFVGLGLLACFGFGRWLDVLFRTGSLWRSSCDRSVWRLFLLTILATASVALNPYGIGLYVEAWQFSANPNLQDLTEWQPMTIRSGEGQAFALVTLLLLLAYRGTPRRLWSWELLTLTGLGLAGMWSVRMVIWWAPVAAIQLSHHGYAIWRASQSRPSVVDPAPQSTTWTWVSLLLVLSGLIVSPPGQALLWNKQPEIGQAVSTMTPVFAAEYLRQHPPQGLVFNTYEWGDYLQWAGPDGLLLFVNSHAHLIPRDTWLAYLQVIELQSGWQETLDRYRVDTIVIDQAYRGSLIERLRQDAQWESRANEQDGQVLFFRKHPIGNLDQKRGPPQRKSD